MIKKNITILVLFWFMFIFLSWFIAWNFLWLYWTSIFKYMPLNLNVCNNSQHNIAEIEWLEFNTWRIDIWECVIAEKRNLIKNRNSFKVLVDSRENNLDENVWLYTFFINPIDQVWLRYEWFWDRTITINNLNTNNDNYIFEQRVWRVWYNIK